MRKKLVAMVLLCAMAQTFVFAQGATEASEPSKKEPITIRLWAGIQPEYGYDDMVKNFNEQFKDEGIQVEYVRYVNNDEGNLQLETYLMGGGDVDVFIGYGGNGRLIPRIESGLVLNMDDYLKQLGFDYEKEMGMGNMSNYLYMGNCYAIPTKYENSGWLLANVDMFKKAGVALPLSGWTYDEFREACKKLTYGEGQAKVYGMAWLFKQDTKDLLAIVRDTLGAKATFKDEAQTQTNFDNPIWNKGLQLVVDTMRTDKTAISLEDEVGDKLSFANTFLTGKCAMATKISQIRLVKDKETYPHDFETALIPGPVPTKEDLKYFDHCLLNGAGDLICVSAKTAHPLEAVKFVIWYIKGGMAPLAKGGRIPLWSGVSKDDVIKAFNTDAEGVFNTDSLKAYLSIRTNLAVQSPASNLDGQIKTLTTEELEKAMYGKKSVDQALADLKTRADKLISEKK